MSTRAERRRAARAAAVAEALALNPPEPRPRYFAPRAMRRIAPPAGAVRGQRRAALLARDLGWGR